MSTALTAEAQRMLRHFIADDPVVEARIREGTLANRTGFAELTLLDRDGRPVPRASVRYAQRSHHYRFGCNLFMLDQFPDPGRNAAYRERFAEFFNLAVVPLYWSDLEPQDGAPRFAVGSPPVYRRPPVDLCLDYCDAHGIQPKGHPLLWHQFWPRWLQGSPAEVRRRVARRFAEISARYAERIHVWDVCNEAQTFHGTMPFDAHVDYAFELAGRHFPGATLTYNDDRKWWDLQGDYSPVYLLMRHLQTRGLPVNALGFQYHMFANLLDQTDQFMHPRHLLRVLDQYAKLGVPINLSEISIISRRDLGDGDAFQAEVAERLYRLWFSHPATDGAVWWNLVDGTAAYAPIGSEEGENSLRAGLLNYDLSEKPAYTALKRLITQEWTSRGALDYQAGAANAFRGFHGGYDLEIETAQGAFRRRVELPPGGARISLRLEASG
ncbi:MAG: endo-1,4-beta-xylanase [Planctomycetes bacterium]|nr:endo-1,4-beta-xylanase [Planctomycetota bacterium]